MPPRTPPPGQLDIPLVWATDPATEGRDPAPAGEPAAAPPARGASAFRLWAGALVDAAIVVIGAAAAVALAAAVGDGVTPVSFALAAAAGLEVVTVLALGCLWGWRGTPEMLAADVCFAQPIPFGRVCRFWAVWVPCLGLAGVPLVLRWRGECAAERLAGGALSSRSLPGAA